MLQHCVHNTTLSGHRALKTYPAIRSSRVLGVSRRRLSASAMAAQKEFDVFVKGTGPEAKQLGDCPFCHRVLLTLEEKNVPYSLFPLDEYNMPDWVEEHHPEHKKSVPLVKELESGKWLADSPKIADYLEDKHPDPKLGKSTDPPAVGDNLFTNFVAYLSSPGPDEAARRGGYLKQNLEEIKNALELSGNPFLGGQNPNARDFQLAPQLYHIKVASKAIQNEDIFQTSAAQGLDGYLDRMKSRASWQATNYSEQTIIDGWKKKLESMKQQQ